MAELTVNQIRVRLGSLVQKMITPDFHETYEMMAPQLKNHAEESVIRFLEASDAYLKVIANHLTEPEQIEAINKFVYPPVVFCVGLRYHLLTCELVEDDQNKLIVVPDDDEAFFKHMMITYQKPEE